MKLEGSLDAFGLPDIFQLLSLTKKTGGLHLRSGAMVGVVHFADGAVTGADADLARQTLARRLVGNATVSDEALTQAVERARQDGVGVGRALMDAGALDADVVRDTAAEVAYDAVFDLLRWPEGEFAFSPEAVNADDVGLHLPVEQVVTCARGRQQTLDSAADVIDSGQQVLTMPATVSTDPELSRAEWALVALADGRRTVEELVDLTGQSYYTQVAALAALVRRGLLEVSSDRQDPLAVLARRIDVLAALEGDLDGPGRRGAAGAGQAAARSAEAGERFDTPTVSVAAQATAPLAAPAEPAAVPDRSAEAAMASAGPGGAPPAKLAAPRADHQDLVPAPPVGLAPAAQLVPEPDLVSTVGGPHVPDAVVPPRPEPFIGRRPVDHPDQPGDDKVDHGAGFGSTVPAAARVSGASPFSQPSAALSGYGASASPVAASGPIGGGASGVGGVNGSAAMAADPDTAALIERDPSVNRSLLLRLIAGVRGL